MSEILLNSVASCKTQHELNQIHDLVKQTKVSKEDVDEAIKDAKSKGFEIGTRVIFFDDHTDIGKVVKFNTSTIGFYTGDRYPIIVKFERGTFEYDAECLTPIK